MDGAPRTSINFRLFHYTFSGHPESVTRFYRATCERDATTFDRATSVAQSGKTIRARLQLSTLMKQASNYRQ